MAFRKITRLIAIITIFFVAVPIHAATEFSKYANSLSRSGVIERKNSDLSYRLFDEITRAEMVKIALKMAGNSTSRCTGKIFFDVDSRLEDLCGYVEAAAQNGIVSKGFSNFRPSDPVTRAEMVKMLFAANDPEPSNVSGMFTDVPETYGDLAHYINFAASTGCVKNWGIFRPDSTSTRGEAFKVASCVMALGNSRSNEHERKFSPSTLAFLKTNTDLDAEQWDNIMKLVNKSEQDSLEWTESYGYCEDIGDDRGYTIGIFGATTGWSNDPWPDGPKLFLEYDRANGSENPSTEGGLSTIWVHATVEWRVLKIQDTPEVFCAKINRLQNDAKWREAIWQTFFKVYIGPSIQLAKKIGYQSALTIGSFVDTALNQWVPSLEDIVSKSTGTNEKSFLLNFYAERSKVVDTNRYNQPPNGMKRVKQWADLLNSWKLDLKWSDSDIVRVTSWKME